MQGALVLYFVGHRAVTQAGAGFPRFEGNRVRGQKKCSGFVPISGENPYHSVTRPWSEVIDFARG